MFPYPAFQRVTCSILVCLLMCALGHSLTLLSADLFSLSRNNIETWSIERRRHQAAQDFKAQFEIIDAVIAGKQSLAGAAVDFQRLYERIPEGERTRLLDYFGNDDESGRLEPRILAVVAKRLEGCPEEQTSVLERLEREYHAMIDD